MSDTGGPSAAFARSRSGITQTTSAEALQLQELSLNSRILATVNPWMNGRPDILLELAGSGMKPDDIASQGAALYGMQNMSALRDSMGGLSPVAQRSVWGKLTETQQRALDQMGYRPPDAGQGSMVGAALGGVGELVAPVWGGVSGVGGPALGGALDVLTWVGDQPAHLYRTIRQLDSWQQWAALGGAAAGLALAPVTFGGSLALSGAIVSAGIYGGMALGGATIAAAATNPAEWWDALNASWDGEKVFERGAQRRARELLGGDELISMAKDIALEIDPYELATELAGQRGGGQQQILNAVQRVAARIVDPGSPEYEQVYGGLVSLVQQEPFLDAVDTLQRGKVSFGRDIADVAGLDGLDHTLVSGMLDGIWLVSLDPTLGAAKLVQWNRVRRFGVTADGGEAFLARLTHLSNTDTLTRANHEAIARAVTTGDFTMMPKEAVGLWHSLQEYRRSVSLLDEAGQQTDEFSRRHLLEYFKHGDGMRRLMEGKATIRGLQHAVIARRNETIGWGRLVREARQFRNAMDDVALERELRRVADEIGVSSELDELLPENVLDDLIHTEINPIGDLVDRPAGQVGAALGAPLGVGPVGQSGSAFLASITSMAPPNRALRIVGEGSEIDLPRFVEMLGRATNLPSRVRDRWLNAMMNQGSVNQRIAVIESFMDTAFTAAGMKSNTELAELADRYIRKSTQAYALGGLDNAALAGIPVKTGVYPDIHQASLIVMPNLTDMMHAIRRGHILKHVAKVTDSNFVEASMSRFWKPAVLMRIGFIPRAAGEEQLAWAMRGLSEGQLGQEFGARSIAMHDAYLDAVKAIESGNVPNRAQIEALNWRFPTHVRPLIRMFARRGWQNPVESMLDDYGQALRGFLETGVGHQIDDVVVQQGRRVGVGSFAFTTTRSAQWYHGLLYGRQGSWRRLVANGVDPTLRQAADSWVRAHADATMRATSAMNASVFEKAIVNPDVEHYMVPDPKNPGKLVEEPMVTVRGERERVGMGDHRYAAAVSHRSAEAFDDDIVGPALAKMYPYFFPGFDDLQPGNVVEAVELARNARSWEARMILSEALQPRDDNWRAAAQVISRVNPELGDIVEQVLLYGDFDWAQMLQRIRRQRKITEDPAVAVRLGEIHDELAAMQPLIDGMASLGVESQAWMAQALSADIAKPSGFYDVAAMRRWRDGATESVTKRPERVWYRGIKSGDTVELRPNPETGGVDLVLKAQHQDGWQADVISMSTLPDQSIGYAMSPEAYNIAPSPEGAFARGAMIEVDADFVLNHYGTTMDEVNARPVQNFNKNGEVGVHYVDHGIDKGEISIVTRHNANPAKYSDLSETDVINDWEGQLSRIDALEQLGSREVFTRMEDEWANYIPDPDAIQDELWFAYQSLRAEKWADGGFPAVEASADELVEAAIAGARDRLRGKLAQTTGAEVGADELVIPAGKWSVQSEADMERVIGSLDDNVDGRWEWIRDVKFRSGEGRSVEQIHTRIHDEFLRVVADHGLAESQWGGYAWTNESLTEMVAFLDTLPDDEFDLFQGVMGWRIHTARGNDDFEIQRTREIERMVETMFQSPDASLTRFQEAINLRGQGGFAVEAPAWTPFYTDRESFERALHSEIYASMLRPENAEHVRKSRFALETADGRRVAQPMQEGVQRIFQPVIGRAPRLDQLVEQGMAEQLTDVELVDWIVGQLLADSNAFRTHPDFIRRLDQRDQAAALSDAVVAYLERADPRAGAWTAPMFGVGYDDPRIAQWVSDLVTGNPTSTPGVAYTDIPRSGVSGAGDVHGVRQARALGGDGGRTWRLAPERDANVTMVDQAGTVMLPDGSHSVGAAYGEAIDDWARTITRKVMTEHSARTRESYRPVGYSVEEFAERGGDALSGVYRRDINGELVNLPPGARITSPEDLFDADGNPINVSNSDLFHADTETGTDMLWPIIGPMVRDFHERRGGLATVVPKRFKQQLGSYRAGEQVPVADQWVTMTRSRIDDVFRTRELDLPNVALAEVRVPPNDTLWDRVVRWGFDSVIGPSIDALVRKPMTFHYYAQAYQQNMSQMAWLLDSNLFGTQIPRAFNLADLDAATTLDVDQVAAVRRLMDQFMYPAAGNDADAARWLVSLGADDTEVLGELQKMSNAAELLGDDATAAAAQRLMTIDTQPFRVLGVAGDDDTARRLVAGYHAEVPANLWDEGMDAVDRYLGQVGSPLPLLADADQFRMMRAARNNYDHVIGTVEDTARLRALENVIPFLDSHEQRTQFATMTRNLLPFWYAEENFLKRWARTMAIDGTVGLATIRKAQLGYMGIKSAGIIRTDANGKDWFVYPGSGLLGEALSVLPIIPDTLPVGVLFQASTDSMLPGVNDRFGTPSVSPWVALPLDGVTTMFPDAVPLKRAILGDIGSSKAALTQFVPTQIQRMWEAATRDEDSSRRYASAMMAAAAMMEAEGRGLPDNASPELVEEYLDKLRNHARIVMWAQMITGFFVPGSPVAINTGENVGSFGWMTALGVESPDELVSTRYRSYLQNLGIDEGTSAFLRDFPNADLEDVINPLAYTVSTSSSASGAPLPATRTGLAWYESNSNWIDSMPEAGAWFLPPDSDGQFDFYSYNQQLVSGLRKQRNPREFIRSLKYRNGASIYFDARDQYEQAAAQLGDDMERKRMLDDVWESWRTSWLNAHPIFAEELVSGDARQRRQRTIDQLRYAIDDPAAPDSPNLEAIDEMSRTFDQYRVALLRLNESRSADNVEKVRQIKALFDEWAAGWVLRHPELEQLWSAVYRPEASL